MLHQYFQNFGELTDCVVIKNPQTKLSRCFGFVQFTTPQIADHVVESRPHIIDGKEIDEEGIVPGPVLMLQMMLEVASGNEDLLKQYRAKSNGASWL